MTVSGDEVYASMAVSGDEVYASMDGATALKVEVGASNGELSISEGEVDIIEAVDVPIGAVALELARGVTVVGVSKDADSVTSVSNDEVAPSVSNGLVSFSEGDAGFIGAVGVSIGVVELSRGVVGASNDADSV